MKILYFGDPAGGQRCSTADWNSLGLYTDDAVVPDSRRCASGTSPPAVVLPDLNAIADELRSLAPDLIVAAFYPERIPESVLDIAPGINVHPSDLPRWRGPDPCVWAIREGDEQTAICIHWLTSGLDEGDILSRQPVVIGPRETGGSLATRLQAAGAEAIAEVALSMSKGAQWAAQPQTGTPTWAPLSDADEWKSIGDAQRNGCRIGSALHLIRVRIPDRSGTSDRPELRGGGRRSFEFSAGNLCPRRRRPYPLW